MARMLGSGRGGAGENRLIGCVSARIKLGKLRPLEMETDVYASGGPGDRAGV